MKMKVKLKIHCCFKLAGFVHEDRVKTKLKLLLGISGRTDKQLMIAYRKEN